MFNLNLRNAAQIQEYDECAKPKITQIFVETNEHQELIFQAMKTFTSCHNDHISKEVHYLLKRVNMHTDYSTAYSLFAVEHKFLELGTRY